jgi:hypothetical protein
VTFVRFDVSAVREEVFGNDFSEAGLSDCGEVVLTGDRDTILAGDGGVVVVWSTSTAESLLKLESRFVAMGSEGSCFFSDGGTPLLALPNDLVSTVKYWLRNAV